MTSHFSNQLLIALPALDDPHFSRGVALICQHDEAGAMGVVVNRASEYTLGDVLAQMNLQTGDAALSGQIVLNGGPVHPERGFVLHDGQREWDSTLVISDTLALTTSRDILEAIAEGEGPQRVVVALGCAGWGAGQLEYELGENSWLTVEADLGVIFDTPVAERYDQALLLLGLQSWMLSPEAGHA